ncbi:hypothetical protein PCASD_15235 [Puccinia coronata f. sp. avenae]|uniref:DDE Tnp4 domain-containing protein n=1 Tax=Puccinia coronata f. sp. avenae TaxID=200324 RepID=A0A2N5TCC8_9BASI|nr:hypothetical protein PCASD_15235 [Puccinia coronata f. sp. avenae]
MQLAQQPEQFFDQNQFLLADSAYPSNQYTIPAYKGADLLIPENVDFNYHLAQSRVWIEHAIGILKGRFANLKDQWNELYKEEEPELAPPVGQDYDDTSNDGLRAQLPATPPPSTSSLTSCAAPTGLLACPQPPPLTACCLPAPLDRPPTSTAPLARPPTSTSSTTSLRLPPPVACPTGLNLLHPPP